MKKFGRAFYLILALLTFGVLGLTCTWIWLKQDLFLYLMLASFALYLVYFIVGLTLTERRSKTVDGELRAFTADLKGEGAGIVYITYLGGRRGIARPSATKRDYLIEIYTSAAKEEQLKRHLWYDLPEREERALEQCLVAKFERATYPFLEKISGKTVYIQSAFCAAARDSDSFKGLFRHNTIVEYGE